MVQNSSLPPNKLSFPIPQANSFRFSCFTIENLSCDQKKTPQMVYIVTSSCSSTKKHTQDRIWGHSIWRHISDKTNGFLLGRRAYQLTSPSSDVMANISRLSWANLRPFVTKGTSEKSTQALGMLNGDVSQISWCFNKLETIVKESGSHV